MARYDAEHKAQTRRRIIETAGRRFKQDGIDGSGVAALMTDAGMTNGAFYAYFESKDDLAAPPPNHSSRSAAAMTRSAIPTPRECNPSST